MDLQPPTCLQPSNHCLRYIKMENNQQPCIPAAARRRSKTVFILFVILLFTIHQFCFGVKTTNKLRLVSSFNNRHEQAVAQDVGHSFEELVDDDDDDRISNGRGGHGEPAPVPVPAALNTPPSPSVINNDKEENEIKLQSSTANVDGDKYYITPTTGITNQTQNGTTICFPWTTEADKWWEMNPDYEVILEQDDELCFGLMENEAKADFFRKLHANQYNTTNCTATYTKRMISSGWAADFGNVASGLVHGLEINRPFQIVQDVDFWHYAAEKKIRRGDKPPICPSGDMFCYFLPIGACKPNQVDKFSTRAKGPLIPWATEYATRQQQWLRREVYDYVSNNAPAVSAPCAAVHVRRADVVLHNKYSRKYFPISSYLDLLRDETGRNWTNILLFTDDQNAIEEAEEFHPEYNWKYLNKTRHRGSSGGWENQIPSGSPKDEVIAILSIFQLAQRCDVFVHSTSGFSTTIYESMLQTGRDIIRLQIDSDYRGRLNVNNSKTELELQGRLQEMTMQQNSGNGTATSNSTAISVIRY